MGALLGFTGPVKPCWTVAVVKGCTEPQQQARIPEGGPGGQVLEVSRVEELRLVETQLGARLQEHVHVVLGNERNRCTHVLAVFISATEHI